MEQLIRHACGHEQLHCLAGFTSQQERKARWLRTTQCRACFIAVKRSEERLAAAEHVAALAHLDLAALTGSDRQVAWATTIRAKRLTTIHTDVDGDMAAAKQACLQINDAKWWIDHRDLPDGELLELANSESLGISQCRLTSSLP